jgi:hypothetical protein
MVKLIKRMGIMKKFIIKQKTLILTVIAVLFLGAINSSACEIEFKVVQGEKDKYQKGDKIVVKIIVVFTHRNCPEGIDATEFKTDGLKIAKATRWEEKSTGTFERKLMLEVTEDKKDINITAIRTCDKEGGFGSLVLSSK